jgi:hypothetical protein
MTKWPRHRIATAFSFAVGQQKLEFFAEEILQDMSNPVG